MDLNSVKETVRGVSGYEVWENGSIMSICGPRKYLDTSMTTPCIIHLHEFGGKEMVTLVEKIALENVPKIFQYHLVEIYGKLVDGITVYKTLPSSKVSQQEGGDLVQSYWIDLGSDISD